MSISRRFRLYFLVVLFVLMAIGSGIAAAFWQDAKWQVTDFPGNLNGTVDSVGDPLPEGAIARLGTIRLGHPSAITAAAFSPHADQVATAGQSIRIWSLPDGRPLREFALPRSRVLGLDYSRDARLLAVMEERSISIIDATTAELKRRIALEHGTNAVSVCFSPANDYLSVQLDSGVVVFESESGVKLADFPSSRADKAWRQDGQALLLADEKGARWRSVSEPLQTSELLLDHGAGLHATLSPNGLQAFVMTGTLSRRRSNVDGWIIDTESKDAEKIPIMGQLVGGHFLSDQTLGVVEAGTTGPVLHLLKTTDLKVIKTVQLNSGVVTARGLIGVIEKRAMSIYDDTGRPVLVAPLDDTLHSIGFTRDGRFVLGSFGNSLCVWDARNDFEYWMTIRGCGTSRLGVCILNDAEILVVDRDARPPRSTLKRINLDTKQVVIERVHENRVVEPLAAIDDRVIALSMPSRHWIELPTLDVSDDQGNPLNGKQIFGVGRFGSVIVATTPFNETAPLELIDIAKDEVCLRIDNSTQIQHVYFSAESGHAAFRDSDGSVQIWDVNKKLLVRKVKPEMPISFVLALSGDGRFLATCHIAEGGDDGQVSIWDVDKGIVRQKILAGTSCGSSMAFSPDGRTLITTGWSPEGIVWRLSPQVTDSTEMR